VRLTVPYDAGGADAGIPVQSTCRYGGRLMGTTVRMLLVLAVLPLLGCHIPPPSGGNDSSAAATSKNSLVIHATRDYWDRPMHLTPVTTICETGGCPRTLCVLATPRFQAPKERHMTAWGNAPGPLTAHISKALKGRNGCLYRPYRARPRRSGFPGALPQAVPSRPAGALHAAATRRGTTQHLGPTGVKCIALYWDCNS